MNLPNVHLSLIYRLDAQVESNLRREFGSNVELHALRLSSFAGVRSRGSSHDRMSWRDAILAPVRLLAYVMSRKRDSARILKALVDTHPDVVHVVMGGFPGARGARLMLRLTQQSGIKTILSIHNQPTRASRLWRVIDYGLLDELLSGVKVITVGSNATLAAFRDAYPQASKAFVTLPNSNPHETLVEEEISKRQVRIEYDFVTVSRIESRKGLGTFVRAIEIANKVRISSGHQGLRVCIVGDGPDMSQLEFELVSLELEAVVDLVGYQADYWKFIRRSRIYVQPSVLNEDSPLATLAAMQLGKPVIASDVGGLPEQVQNELTGYIVKCDNAVELSERMLELIESGCSQKQLGAAGRKWYFAHFSNRDLFSKVSGLYEALSRRDG